MRGALKKKDPRGAPLGSVSLGWTFEGVCGDVQPWCSDRYELPIYKPPRRHAAAPHATYKKVSVTA